MSFANYITLLRIFMVPLLAYFVYYHKQAAIILYVILAFTDWLDGFLARKMNVISDLGKFLDPLADKVLVISMLLIFLDKGYLEIASMIFLISREFIVQGIRLLSLENGDNSIGATKIAKLKTFILMASIFFLLIKNIYIGKILYYGGVTLAFISLVDYLYQNKYLFKKGD